MEMSSITAGAITAASGSNLQTGVALSLTKKAMEFDEQQGQELIQSMNAVATGLGQNVDMRA